jgi:hypothetical protein
VQGLRLFVAVIVACCLTVGCSQHYVMTTNDGAMLLASGKPSLDSKTGVLSYRDEQGQLHQINNDQISGVIAR